MEVNRQQLCDEENQALKCQLGMIGVSEVYSPPRVTARAEQFGIQAGFALDLTVPDPEDGNPWDFSVRSKREKCKRMVQEETIPTDRIAAVYSVQSATSAEFPKDGACKSAGNDESWNRAPRVLC